MPADEIRDWAETAVSTSGGPGSSPILSGWLSENTSAHQTTDLRSQEAGVHQAQLACRGDGIITLTAGGIDAEPSGEPIVCANETIAFDITTTATGMRIVMDLEGDPTIYALTLKRMS